jgi:single-stranded DNA-binding protein
MNVLILTGRLTADPVRRDTPKGVVCEFRMTVDIRPRLWIPVQAWGQLAGRCAQHLRAGRHVAVAGRLICEEYVTRAGEKVTRWYTRATTVTFLDRPEHHDASITNGSEIEAGVR